MIKSSDATIGIFVFERRFKLSNRYDGVDLLIYKYVDLIDQIVDFLSILNGSAL